MEFNLADLWEAVADAIPDREALVCGDRRLTYAELDERAHRLAHDLAAHGVGPGDHVAVYLYNGTEYLEAMLAAFKLRAVPINVNYRYVEDELRYLLDDADAKAVVFHREFAPNARRRARRPAAAHALRGGRRRRRRPAVRDALADLAPLEYEAALAARFTGPRLRAPFARRPLRRSTPAAPPATRRA